MTLPPASEVDNRRENTGNDFGRWPNFIVIGPGKSGTSWLYEVFGQHPQIGMSSAKETLFFETEFERGLDWYAKFFRPLDPAALPAIGEVSNTYIFSPDAAARIAATFPDMRIIATLRNPIERAFSHFLFERRNGTLGDDFDAAIDRRPDLLSRGLYDEHLEPYFQRFSDQQRLILIYDDMKSDIVAYAETLFGFLGVESSLDASVLERRVLGASEARNATVARVVVGAGRLIRGLGFPEWVTKLKNTSLARSLFRPIDPESRPVMSDATAARLRDYYRDDVTRLSDRLNRDLVSLWLDSADPKK